MAFKKFLSNTLNNKFDINDKATNPDNLYKLGTRVNKSFIRVESDEVTYPLHIILRFNLERKIKSDIISRSVQKIAKRNFLKKTFYLKKFTLLNHKQTRLKFKKKFLVIKISVILN